MGKYSSLVAVVVILHVFLATTDLKAQEMAASRETEEAIYAEKLVNDFIEVAIRLSDSPSDDNNRSRLSTITDSLVQIGKASVPAIKSQIDDVEDPSLQKRLLLVLSRIGGEQVDKLLIKYLVNDYHGDVRSAAMSELVWRIRRNGSLTFPLETEQISFLAEGVEKAHAVTAGFTVELLANCVANPVEDRINPILNRFIRQINEEVSVTRLHGVYLSPRTYYLLQFLNGFEHFGEEVWVILKEKHEQFIREDRPEEAKWFAMARGSAGDPAVADLLAIIVQKDPDPYTRCVSIYSYKSSAQEKAIPLLRKLLNDTFSSEYQEYRGGPLYMIANTARDELSELKQD